MQPIPSCFRWYIGNPEYILAKAGLFEINGDVVLPTNALTRLLDPLPDELLPLLVRVAEICALEIGGALDTTVSRREVTWRLRKLGLMPADLGDLFVLVKEGAQAVAEERRNLRELPR